MAERKPELIIIAGPNGSGKTSVTKKFLHHEWAEGTTYINPDEIRKSICKRNSPVGTTSSSQRITLYTAPKAIWVLFNSFNPA